MPAHETNCVACGQACYCPNDSHALGVGGGCSAPLPNNFCSVKCFCEFFTDMAERIDEILENLPHHFTLTERQELKALRTMTPTLIRG